MTTDRECVCGTEAVRDQAATWFARSRDGDLDAGERLSFEAWLVEHHQHAHEYRLLQNLWGVTDLPPKAQLDALCEAEAPRPVAPPIPRRTVWRYAPVAILLVLLTAGGLYASLDDGTPEYSIGFITVPGEQRQVALPDGSVLDLNGHTRLNAHFFETGRQVDLFEGEAIFSVEHDSDRPFVVQTGNGSVTVTGTRFNVKVDATQTWVVVESGTVKVRGKADPQDHPVILTAGQGSTIDLIGNATPATAVDSAAVMAWRSGNQATFAY